MTKGMGTVNKEEEMKPLYYILFTVLISFIANNSFAAQTPWDVTFTGSADAQLIIFVFLFNNFCL